MGADPAVVYSDANLGTLWAVVDAAHPNAVGHRGCDWHLPGGGGSEVVAYRSGTVVSTPFSSILGNCVVVQYGPGLFGYWAHLRAGTRPNVGTPVKWGSRIGLAASGPKTLPQTDPNYPGSAWLGCHIHHGTGPLLSSVFGGDTFNPLPYVRLALAEYASGYVAGTTPSVTPASTGGTTPVSKVTPNTQEEDDMTPDQSAKLDALAIGMADLVAAAGAGNARLPGVVPAKGDILSNVRAAVTNTNAIQTAISALPALINGVDEAVWATQVGRTDANGKVYGVSALQELADAKTNVLHLVETSGIDLTALAAKIVADQAANTTSSTDLTTVIEATIREELGKVFVLPKS